jgi:ERCC4-related helicase
MEEIARSYIIKEALEKLGCTYEDMSKAKEESKENSQECLDDEEMFKQIDSINTGASELVHHPKLQKPLIIIDA